MPKSKTQIQCKYCDKTLSASVFVNHLRTRHSVEFDKLVVDCEQLIQTYEQRHCPCGNRLLRKRNWLNVCINAYFLSRPIDDVLPKTCGRSCRKHQKPWNFGVTKNDHASMLKVSISKMGKNNPVYKILADVDKSAQWREKLSVANKGKNAGMSFEDIYGEERALEIKTRQSISAKKRTIHGHTGKRHSEQTKRLLALKAVQQLCQLKNKVSLPHRKLYERLVSELGDNVALECVVGHYAIDIAYKDLAIEVDGDFFHCNENQGYLPKYAVQKKNLMNDKLKNAFLQNSGWRVVRIWEHDINSNIDSVVEHILSLVNSHD